MKIFCDNQAAISIKSIHHDQTKHVEIDLHFIKKIEEWTISLVYTPTTLQTINILTKALSRTNFEELRSKLGTINIYNLARGGNGNPKEIWEVQVYAQLCYNYSCATTMLELCQS